MPSVPTDIDWENLTPAGLWAVRHLALPLAIGCTELEVAQMHRRSRPWLRARLAELRGEIEANGNGDRPA